jgi:hypothetical protein
MHSCARMAGWGCWPVAHAGQHTVQRKNPHGNLGAASSSAARTRKAKAGREITRRWHGTPRAHRHRQTAKARASNASRQSSMQDDTYVHRSPSRPVRVGCPSTNHPWTRPSASSPRFSSTPWHLSSPPTDRSTTMPLLAAYCSASISASPPVPRETRPRPARTLDAGGDGSCMQGQTTARRGLYPSLRDPCHILLRDRGQANPSAPRASRLLPAGSNAAFARRALCPDRSINAKTGTWFPRRE